MTQFKVIALILCLRVTVRGSVTVFAIYTIRIAGHVAEVLTADLLNAKQE